MLYERIIISASIMRLPRLFITVNLPREK